MEDTRDIKNVRAMKQVLVQKLKDEQTYFSHKDISIRLATKVINADCPEARKSVRGYEITIKDYEHCPFFLHFDYSEYFGYEVWVWEEDRNKLEDVVSLVTSKKEHKVEQALIELGYHIANTF